MTNPVGDFSLFDRRARDGERLSVVFLGGSLTWGARATDPMLTSYRALIGQRLTEFYPKAHFTFWDASVGGTGSQLALFRLDRDVLRRKPDLVFLEFAVNDGPWTADEERLASYEALVRRVILEAGAPLVLSMMAVKEDVGPDAKPRIRDVAHTKIGNYYQTGIGNSVEVMRKAVEAGQVTGDEMWPYPPDVTHPGDKGYARYAEAAWTGFREAVDKGSVCRAPETMLHAATYMKSNRQRLSQLGVESKGWKPGLPTSFGIAFDFYMSRWLDDVMIANADTPALRLEFEGSMVMIFGEATATSGKFQALIDGKPTVTEQVPDGNFQARCAGGSMHLVRTIAEGLDPKVKHTLEIIPQLKPGEELRIESVCVAGGTTVTLLR